MTCVHFVSNLRISIELPSQLLTGVQKTRVWDIPAPPSEPSIPEGVKVFDVSVPLGDGYKPFDIKLRWGGALQMKQHIQYDKHK